MLHHLLPKDDDCSPLLDILWSNAVCNFISCVTTVEEKDPRGISNQANLSFKRLYLFPLLFSPSSAILVIKQLRLQLQPKLIALHNISAQRLSLFHLYSTFFPKELRVAMLSPSTSYPNSNPVR